MTPTPRKKRGRKPREYTTQVTLKAVPMTDRSRAALRGVMMELIRRYEAEKDGQHGD